MTEKKKKLKGQKKQVSDSETLGENPLLKIDNRDDFSMESSNLLQDPGGLAFPGFENFDINRENGHFDVSRLRNESVVIVALRYYEYVCVARFRFDFIVPILESGLTAEDVFGMIRHALRNRLLLNAPSFDTIFEPDIRYVGKIKY